MPSNDVPSRSRLLSRREVLRIGGMGLLASPLTALASCQKQASPSFVPPNGAPFEGTDEQLLDEIERASFDFFWNEASPKTGQVKDRALANGNDSNAVSSIARPVWPDQPLDWGPICTMSRASCSVSSPWKPAKFRDRKGRGRRHHGAPRSPFFRPI